LTVEAEKFRFGCMLNQHTMTTPVILYVDDDKDDCHLLKESFAATTTSLVCLSGGEDAIRYLNNLNENYPSLIILDLNMPRWDGRQTLNYIITNPRFSKIPVVILSTSENKIDKEVCKRLGASSYLQKPIHFEGYRKIVEKCMPLLEMSREAAC
jgi:CheY-like chemotaxis protein